ncbi:hypothetical protein Trydic_g9326 [Trypoxylus dichotomus]
MSRANLPTGTKQYQKTINPLTLLERCFLPIEIFRAEEQKRSVAAIGKFLTETDTSPFEPARLKINNSESSDNAGFMRVTAKIGGPERGQLDFY